MKENNTDLQNGKHCLQGDVKRSCLTCKYFHSWEDIYEDELEPFDSGLCKYEESDNYNKGVGENDDCEYYKASNCA